ncbi:MAG: TIGR03747 family integrating conjugative element membrane protein, partial [Saezia sp.]
MTQNTSQTQEIPKPKTITGKLLALPFAAFGIICASLVLSIIIELLGTYFVWPDEGWHHARDMFYYEVEQLDATFTKSLIFSSPIQTTESILAHAYEWLFIKSGLLQSLENNTANSSLSTGVKMTFRAYLGQVVEGSQTYLLAAAYTTLTVMVRVVILVLSIPLILLAVFVGFVDGLVRRD